jgi:hypothetical protein
MTGLVGASLRMLRSRGFGEKWIGWIRRVVRGGLLCIRINDENNGYFKPGKGLRQGILFLPFYST